VKLSDGVEWALHCATVLAVIPEGATLPAKSLAELHAVSESYLLKHLKKVVAAGLFETLPGPRGGYRLARSPEKIRVLDIVLAVEGQQPLFRCTEIRQNGPAALASSYYRAPCLIHAAMLQAEHAWRQSLAEVRLSDLVGRLTRTMHPDAREKGEKWLLQNVRA